MKNSNKSILGQLRVNRKKQEQLWYTYTISMNQFIAYEISG